MALHGSLTNAMIIIACIQPFFQITSTFQIVRGRRTVVAVLEVQEIRRNRLRWQRALDCYMLLLWGCREKTRKIRAFCQTCTFGSRVLCTLLWRAGRAGVSLPTVRYDGTRTDSTAARETR